MNEDGHWRTVDESIRPLGLGPGESTTWGELDVHRVHILGPNLLFRVRAGNRVYRIGVHELETGALRVAVYRVRPRSGGSSGLLVRKRIENGDAEQAVHLGLEIVRGVDAQRVPSPESRPLHRRATYATFCLYGYALDPDVITARTGLQPSRRLPAPQVSRLVELGPWRDGAWFLKSAASVDSLQLTDHIRWLLDRLEPAREAFPRWVQPREAWEETKPSSFYAVISCYWSDGAANPYFDALLLQRAAALDLGIDLDIYARTDDEDGDV